jgi:hypothetical protein
MPKTKKKVCTHCGCEKQEPVEYDLYGYEVQYFHDHLPGDLRRYFDSVERKEGRAAAFGRTLQIVLANEIAVTVNLPDNVTVLPPRKPAA